MKRRATFLIGTLLCALCVSGGIIRIDVMNTYDTGIRAPGGRWIVGSTVQMTWFDAFGNRAVTDWDTQHWIEDVATATIIASTGRVNRRTDVWSSTLSGTGDYSTCYRGKGYAAVGVPGLGGDVKNVSGNQVCTSARPIVNPPCEWRPEGCGEPIENCPLIVNTGNGPWHLSGLNDSVLFDIDADGQPDRISWTARGSSLAFVALDRNGNGMIDDASELFGNHTPLPNGSIASNGFEALKAFDRNRDDQIDEHDTVWSALLLWTDENHDGRSQSGELTEIANSPIRAVGTDYHWTGRTDRIGNEFRFQSMLLTDSRQEPYYDIFFLMAQ